MLAQNLIGAAVFCLSILVSSAFIGLHFAIIDRCRGWVGTRHRWARFALALSAILLSMILVLSLSAWIWAGVFLYIGEFRTFEEAVYFSMVAFTTLGFGDVLISQEWRLLSGIAAANGLILFSLMTAVLFEFVASVRSLANTTPAKQ